MVLSRTNRPSLVCSTSLRRGEEHSVCGSKSQKTREAQPQSISPIDNGPDGMPTPRAPRATNRIRPRGADRRVNRFPPTKNTPASGVETRHDKVLPREGGRSACVCVTQPPAHSSVRTGWDIHPASHVPSSGTSGPFVSHMRAESEPTEAQNPADPNRATLIMESLLLGPPKLVSRARTFPIQSASLSALFSFGEAASSCLLGPGGRPPVRCSCVRLSPMFPRLDSPRDT
jgi:hypothetical protein